MKSPIGLIIRKSSETARYQLAWGGYLLIPVILLGIPLFLKWGDVYAFEMMTESLINWTFLTILLAPPLVILTELVWFFSCWLRNKKMGSTIIMHQYIDRVVLYLILLWTLQLGVYSLVLDHSDVTHLIGFGYMSILIFFYEFILVVIGVIRELKRKSLWSVVFFLITLVISFIFTGLASVTRS